MPGGVFWNQEMHVLPYSRTMHQGFEKVVVNMGEKKYCLGCLYLPSNLQCVVKEDGKVHEIHITTPACSEYIEKR